MEVQLQDGMFNVNGGAGITIIQMFTGNQENDLRESGNPGEVHWVSAIKSTSSFLSSFPFC
jgi:hypothetical protein